MINLKNFCAFILSHGRPDDVITYKTLKKQGYTGKIFIIVDNEDNTIKKYIENFGKESVIIFDKKKISRTFDSLDNFDNRKTIVYARNACFDIAKDLSIKYFIQLDDDYTGFLHRTESGSKETKNLDLIFYLFLNFLKKTNIQTVAFSQGGDHIGGFDKNYLIKRKAMNSFFCSTNRRFKFLGRINEDVNTYVKLGSLGKVFLTIYSFQLNQKTTQKNKGGMTDVYIKGGTYLKSFYSVLLNPSSVKIKMMMTKHLRLHHQVNWDNTAVKIIDQKYKKYAT